MPYSYNLGNYLTPHALRNLEKRCEGKITYRHFETVNDAISLLIHNKYPKASLEDQDKIYNKIRPQFEDEYKVRVIIEPIDKS